MKARVDRAFCLCGFYFTELDVAFRVEFNSNEVICIRAFFEIHSIQNVFPCIMSAINGEQDFLSTIDFGKVAAYPCSKDNTIKDVLSLKWLECF